MRKKSSTGQYRHKVTFRIPTGTEIEGIPQYTDGATVWAAVEPLKGREFWEAQAAQAENIVKIKMRYLTGVKQEWQIRFQLDATTNIDYEIANIIDVEMRHKELHLMCRAVS
jgi:SPP1 family predicted phage head-tail adaptor